MIVMFKLMVRMYWMRKIRTFTENSAGAILGGGYVGLHGGFDKIVLGVGGMPFAHFLTRSTGFAPFLQVLETLYEDWREITLLIGLFENQWEPA